MKWDLWILRAGLAAMAAAPIAAAITAYRIAKNIPPGRPAAAVIIVRRRG